MSFMFLNLLNVVWLSSLESFNIISVERSKEFKFYLGWKFERVCNLSAIYLCEFER